jgi:hypothetical protein
MFVVMVGCESVDLARSDTRFLARADYCLQQHFSLGIGGLASAVEGCLTDPGYGRGASEGVVDQFVLLPSEL